MNRLSILSGSMMGKSFEVKDRAVTIGNAHYNTIVLEDPALAGELCSLVFKAGGWSVRDLGAPPGTFVNGKKVEKEAALKSGDTIKAGKLTFQVQFDGRDPQDRAGAAKEATKAVAVGKGGPAAAPRPAPAPPPAAAPAQLDMGGLDDYMKMLKSGQGSALRRPGGPPPPKKP